MNAVSLVAEAASLEHLSPLRALATSRPSALRPVRSSLVTYRVLLLESDRTYETLLAEAVRAEIPDAEITRATGALGAFALMELYSFDLLLIDALLHGDIEEQLVAEFRNQNPKAEVILCCPDAEARGGILSETDAAYLHFLQTPANPLELLESVRRCRDRVPVPVTNPDPDNEGYFVVVLSRHTPVEVVQFKCLSGATTALDFSRRDGPGGRVWFARGEIIHAETETMRGEEALIEMINWPGGSIVEVSVPPPEEQSIRECWTSLLMRAANAADERRRSTDLGGERAHSFGNGAERKD
jgi:DNA-binding response OmpR family regulator